MGPTKIYRDESTPDRKEIWTFVERAAARADEIPRSAEERLGQEREPSASQVRCSGSGQE